MEEAAVRTHSNRDLSRSRTCRVGHARESKRRRRRKVGSLGVAAGVATRGGAAVVAVVSGAAAGVATRGVGVAKAA